MISVVEPLLAYLIYLPELQCDGLFHISHLGGGSVAKTTDAVVKKGDKVWFKLIGFDEHGQGALVDEGRRLGQR